MDIGKRRLELGAHLVEWLDRGDPVPEADERAGELPGAGAEIDDVARVQSDEPANSLVRIAGAAALVRARDLRERRVRPTHRVVAVDDHRVECRPAPAGLDSTRRVIPRISSDGDLGGAVAHRDEARHDVEDALARAEGDVLLELRRVLHEVAAALRRAERLLRPAPRRCQSRCGYGGVGALPVEQLDDAARDVRVVERERPLHAGADDDDVLARARARPPRQPRG